MLDVWCIEEYFFRTNGKSFVNLYKRTQDGLSVWTSFLDIYQDSGNKATEITKHELIIGLTIDQYDGSFVDFINEQEKACIALADLGKDYDFAARLDSTTRRISTQYGTYGWMVNKIETEQWDDPKAIVFLCQQGI